MRWLRNTLAMALALFAFGCCVAHVAGCTPAERLTVENAAAVAQYDRALVACKEESGGSFVNFELCETKVTRDYCRSSEALRKEWPKCKEFQ